MSPVTPPLLPLPQSSAELYRDLLSRSKALSALSFSGLWLPLEKSCAAKPSFSLGQSLKGNRQLCSPNCRPERGACAWEGRKEVSLPICSAQGKLGQLIASGAAEPEVSCRTVLCAGECTRGRSLHSAMTCVDSQQSFLAMACQESKQNHPLLPSVRNSSRG